LPVTAKLSRSFYERLGDEIANELVDWFNAVDATYRNDLRELNELNFQRFDDRVERRFAEFQAKIEQRLTQFETKIEQRLAEHRVEVAAELASLRGALADQRAELLRWMFAFWAATLIPLAGLIVALRVF
jgi:hypothetical protein